MKRREFLAGTAGLLGSAVAYRSWAQEKPCPPSALQVGGGTSVSTVCSSPPATGSPGWMQGRSINEWFEIPGTHLSSVEPRLDAIQRAFNGPVSKITTWQGATLRRQGSVYMLGACGGHGDYAGNEVDAISLNTDSPRWVELRGPSLSADIIDDVECYLDRRRSATHTYYSQQFNEATNRMIVMPAPGMRWDALPKAPADWPYTVRRPMAFSMETNDWLAPENYEAMPLAGGSDFTACLACTNHATGEIYYARNYDEGRLWKFDPRSGSMMVVGQIWHGNYAGSAIDPVRNRMLVVGDYSGKVAPRIIDLGKGTIANATFAGLGAEVLIMSGYPGVVFDESNDQFLVFKNSNPISVYQVNAATLHVSVLPTTSNPPGRQNGIQNSIQFVPELKGVVIATSYGGNLHFMRVA